MPLAVRRSGKQAVPFIELGLEQWHVHVIHLSPANLPGFLVARYIRSLPACWWWPRSVSTVDLGKPAGPIMLGWSAVGPASYGWWINIDHIWSMIVASNKELWEVRFTFTHVCGPNGGTVMHSAGSGSIAQWQGCCADECAMLMMEFVSWNLTFIYIFWSGAGSGFWYRRCLLLSLVQIGRLQQKRGLGIRDDYGVHKCF